VSRLARATEVIGLPVVTLAGEDVAEVRDVVYDAERGGLLGFTLNQRGFLSGRLKQRLAVADVHAIGHDAVMVTEADALHERDEAPEPVRDPSADGNVIGAPVITEDGDRLGSVSDVVLRLGTAVEAVGYELERSDPDHADRQPAFVPLPEQVAVSGDALLVPSGFESFVRDDLTGFGGAVDEYRSEHHSRSGGAKRPSDDRTKTELYEEAKELDVKGRSSMTKSELLDALSDRRT
jgi:uncharacterized protein YrrD